MKALIQIFLLSILLLLSGCIVQFIPETEEDKESLVVEGLITDQPVAYTIKLSKSLPLSQKKYVPKPVKGCIVKISDDQGETTTLKESVTGTYITDPAKFRGKVGRKYTLEVNTNTKFNNLIYQSLPMEMKPVPVIDSLYYEKMTLKPKDEEYVAQEGCQVYLNTYDPENKTKFYRWEYSETWEFRLPYNVPNRVCWISANSDKINIRNTSVFAEDRVTRYPLNFISNQTDRLRVKYSIRVNQYALTEDEYLYWEKLQNVAEQVGGLYDITPAAIPSNIFCTNDPKENVLGYFSVSAETSKRIFIKDYFSGVVNLYTNCATDTIIGTGPIPNLGISVWVIFNDIDGAPPTRILTDTKGCADCSVRGTTVEPAFWKEGK